MKDVLLPSDSPPALDRALLLLHCGGDERLAREILTLMLRQVEMAEAALPGADVSRRADLAHGLKGAARGCGALALAHAASDVEIDPSDKRAVAALQAALGALRAILRREGRTDDTGG